MSKETLQPKLSVDRYLALRESSFKIDSKEFELMRWERDALNALDSASNETGINAWMATGLLYRPFFNGRFGPHQLGMDKDVQVAKDEDRKPLLTSLQKIQPDLRWTVEDRVAYTETDYGIKTKTLEQALSIFPLRFREGAIRSVNGKLEILITPGALEDLQNGIVRIDETFLPQVPAEFKDIVIEKALTRARKTLHEYPGLKLEGILTELYEARYGKHTSAAQIVNNWQDISEMVKNHEHGGRMRWSGMSPNEVKIAQEFRDFYLKTAKDPSAPPRPKPSRLPGILEDARKRRQGPTVEFIAALDGFANWLHYATSQSTDDEFKEWIVNQTRSRNPIGGKDLYLAQVLSYNLFDAYIKSSGIDKPQQKLTHQGGELSLHLRETLFQLETDQAIQLVEQSQQNSLRMAMRMAMLFHDVGKIQNVYTPGAHELLSAKMWEQTKPDWVNPQEAKMVEWIIKMHDLLGRLERGIVEKQHSQIHDDAFDPSAQPSYKGALDPSTVRDELIASGLDLKTALAIHKEIWKADVGSVASLRWLLPAADILARIVLKQ